jgi:hypothetical protein
MRIDVDVANRRVEAAFLGLFGKQRAAYADGYGCTLVSNDENLDRAIASPLPSLPTPDSLWPVGEKVQLSDNRRLQAAMRLLLARWRVRGRGGCSCRCGRCRRD